MPTQPAFLDRWHEAFEAKDIDALAALLADDVVFRSPAVFAPQEGKPITKLIELMARALGQGG